MQLNIVYRLHGRLLGDDNVILIPFRVSRDEQKM